MKDYLIIKRLKELCKNGHLSNDENILLFEEYMRDKQNGIAPEDSEARTLLILGNRKLIFHVIRKRWNIVNVEESEEASVGQIGLVKAIDTFRLDANAKFSTYASNVIQNEVSMYYRALRSRHLMPEQQIFLEDCIKDDVNDDEKLHILDTIYDTEDFVQQIQDKCLFDCIVDKIKYLTYNEAYSIIMVFGLFGNSEHAHGEVAETLKITRSYVSRNITFGLKKLKILIAQENELSSEDKIIKYRMIKQGPLNNLVNEMNI